MLPEFLLSVFETAIGSGLGFVLGICAFRYQQRQQSAAKEKRDQRAALDALNRLNTAAGANIEALAIAKKSYIDKLSGDATFMRAACDRWLETPVEGSDAMAPSIKKLAEPMYHFYKSFSSNFNY